MKIEEYRAMLKSVDDALAICHASLSKMDETHRKICDDLLDARNRLLRMLNEPAQAAP